MLIYLTFLVSKNILLSYREFILMIANKYYYRVTRKFYENAVQILDF